MAGELNQVSMLLGQLTAKIEGLAQQHERIDKKLTTIDERLEPLDNVISDHAKIVATQAKHDAIIQKGSGFLVAVSFFFGLLGFVVQQTAALVMRKLGFISG